MFKQDCGLKMALLKMKIYVSKLLNLYKISQICHRDTGVFAISLSCFFKMLSSNFLMLIKRDCQAD